MIARATLLGLIAASAVWAAGALAQVTPEKPDAAKQPAPAGPEAPVEVLLIEGQVTDAIGAGVSGVGVTVFRKAADGATGERIAETATDKLGDFQVKVGGVDDLNYGHVIVVFSKPSFVELTREAEITVGRVDDPTYAAPYLAETLVSKLFLAGKVENAADHSPIAGAAIELQASYQHWQATSGADGTFKIQGVAAGRGELAVTAAGFGREHQRIKNTADAGELTIVLKPERVVRVRVLDDQKQPVAGVVVEVADEPRGDFRSMIADEQGDAVFKGIHFDARKLICRVTERAHVSSAGFDRAIELPAEKTDSQHELILQRAATITGTVSDPSGKPLYGARVSVGSLIDDNSPRDWTDPEGQFEIVGVATGACVLTVHLDGYAPDLKKTEAQIGESAAVDFNLAEAATIRGRIVDENDKPVAQAEVWATRWRGHASLGLRAMSGADGTFTIENAPHDEFEADVFGPLVKGKSVKLSAAKSPIEIVLEIGDEMGEPTTLTRGQEAPALVLTALSGERIELSALKGKAVVLDFWATWCAPCVAELPRLSEVYEKYRGRKNFVMIGVSRDFSESDLKTFLKDHPGVAWPQVFGEAGGAEEAVQKFGVSGIPALFVIETNGRVFASDIGADELVEHIEKVFALAAGSK